MPYLHNHRVRAWAWTEADDEALRAAYGTATAREVGERLGRTENAIWVRARALGLNKREAFAPWGEAEQAYLRRRYSVDPVTVIAKHLGRTASATQQQAKVLGLLSAKTLLTQSAVGDYFSDISTPEQAYILGLLASDGNVNDGGQISFGLQAKDEELVVAVRQSLAPAHALQRTAKGFVSFSFTSKQMASDLARWGVVPRKSRVLAWPHELGDMQRPFLLGYFDGDGSACITSRENKRVYPIWSVCSGSRELLEGLDAFVRESTGVRLDAISHRVSSSLYQVSVLGSGAYVVDKWLHQDGLGLARKRYPPDVLERYLVPAVPGRTKNGVATWAYETTAKAAAVEALRQERLTCGGVTHGDITRVAAQLGIDPQSLRRWARQASEPT